MKPTKSGQSAFTLLEALFAILILGVSLLGLGHLMIVSMELNQAADYRTKATELAQAKLEELQAQFTVQMASGQSSGDLADGSHGPEKIELTIPEGVDQAQRSFLVNWDVVSLGGGLKGVTVEVRPEFERFRVTRTVSLETYLSP